VARISLASVVTQSIVCVGAYTGLSNGPCYIGGGLQTPGVYFMGFTAYFVTCHVGCVSLFYTDCFLPPLGFSFAHSCSLYPPQILPKSRFRSGAYPYAILYAFFGPPVWPMRLPFPFPMHHNFPLWLATDCASALPWALHVRRHSHCLVRVHGLAVVCLWRRRYWGGGWVLCGAILCHRFLQDGAEKCQLPL
jgi:hypothetical protein